MKKLEYLDNNIKIYQDDELYTFTSDSIKLSRFANVKKGDVVADFCAGSGVVGFNLYAVNPDKISSVTFFELQESLADLCRESIELNGLNDRFSVVMGKIQELDKSFYGKFSLIVCNPPYVKDGAGEKNKNETERTETSVTLKELFFAVSRALKYGGRVDIVHRADRLADIICTMREFGIEPKTLAPLSAKGKKPYCVLLEGVKGGKSGLSILNTIYN